MYFLKEMEMEEDKERNEAFICPVGRFFMEMGKKPVKESQFAGHLKKSRLEFLKAIRSLIDDGISSLEKSEKEKQGKKAQKIDVE